MEEQKGKSEYESYIKTLPLKSIQIGGCRRLIRLDEPAKKAFLLDNEGNWTGKVASLPQVVVTEDVSSLRVSGANNSATTNATSRTMKGDGLKNTAFSGTHRQKKLGDILMRFSSLRNMGKKKRISCVFVILTLLLLVVLSILSISSLGSHNDDRVLQSSGESLQEIPMMDENYGILIASRDILPGEKIIDEDLSVLYISQTEYAVQSSQPLCLSENKDDVVGCYTLSFIPKGRAIVDISKDEPVVACSPWGVATEGHYSMLIPIVADENLIPLLVIGNHAKIVITRTTVDTDYKPKEPVKAEGIGHETTSAQATTTDIFTIDNVVIADLINANGESLYAVYDQYFKISPVIRDSIARQSLTVQNVSRFVPCFVKIILTQQQREVIGEILLANTTVEFLPLRHSDGSVFCEDKSYQSQFMGINTVVLDVMSASDVEE